MWKRTLDVVGAGTGMLILSPLLILTAIAIKLTSKGPILFQQERDGLGGRRFVIFK
ncbi:MAG: sugar transferase, partial [Planctomycetaceae bacterium]|nr:sugar transferase [Planctomycetaceae bacterium]